MTDISGMRLVNFIAALGLWTIAAIVTWVFGNTWPSWLIDGGVLLATALHFTGFDAGD